MTKKITKKPRVDVHAKITAQIIKSIEAGAGEWQMPWHRAGKGLNRPDNIDTKNHYRGINVLALWVEAMAQGFGSGTWGTYRQWQKQGCQVRKGEKASLVVIYKEIKRKDAKATPGDESSEKGKGLTCFMARAASVFNAEQVDGYEAPESSGPDSQIERLFQVERFIDCTRADIRHGGGRAYYRRGEDYIQMPKAGRFVGSGSGSAADGYYGTLLHELTHWAGAESRCNREFGERFGDDAYAMEELVAELGSAFLCADLAVTPEPRVDHAQYLEHWLKVLKADNRAIFAAAAQASKAVEYLAGLQGN